jgi:uncharacterized protein (DUF1697 family)
MQVWIALFRGVNVSGKNIMPMAELRALMTDLGLVDTKTYIQSGNVVFRSDSDRAELRQRILDGVEKQFGIRAPLMLLQWEELEDALKKNPFPDGEADPKSLHLSFMASPPKAPDLEEMTKWQKDSESFQLIGKVFYLHAPEGIGRSKLAERVERLLGEPTTARNWRSATKILELAQSL